jgi:hypothetical protein
MPARPSRRDDGRWAIYIYQVCHFYIDGVLNEIVPQDLDFFFLKTKKKIFSRYYAEPAPKLLWQKKKTFQK